MKISRVSEVFDYLTKEQRLDMLEFLDYPMDRKKYKHHSEDDLKYKNLLYDVATEIERCYKNGEMKKYLKKIGVNIMDVMEAEDDNPQSEAKVS